VIKPLRPYSLLFLALIAATLTACGGSSTPTGPGAGDDVPFSTTDLRDGTGQGALPGRTLTVNYSGWLYDANRPDQKGELFDSSAGRGPYTFVLGGGRVIPGWDQGLIGMKLGGVRRLVIPPSLAYGAAGSGSIPPNATLVFEVELVGIS
jgi:FKBP-type peptidyl-prolyl cis-trans isomerase FkpA